MQKTLMGLVPLAVAVAVVGIIVWLFLSRNMAIGRWLLAAFLVGHGGVHLMYVIPRPAEAAASAGGVEFPFDLGRSWLLSGLDPSVLRVAGMVLVGAVVVGFMLAALATVGLLVPSGWWQGLVLGSAITSLVLLGLFYQPGVLIGLAIDAVLLWVVLASAWTPVASLVQRGAG